MGAMRLFTLLRTFRYFAANTDLVAGASATTDDLADVQEPEDGEFTAILAEANAGLETEGDDDLVEFQAAGQQPAAARRTPASQAAGPNAQMVRIGTVEMPLDKVQPFIEQELGKITQEREALRPAIQLWESFNGLNPAQQQYALDQIEALADNPAPGVGNRLTVHELEIPADQAKFTSKEWDELDDETKTVYMYAKGVRGEVRELSRMLTGMQQFLQSLNADRQDALIVDGLKTYGITTDVAGVRKMRASGIADPLLAAKNGIIKPSQATAPTKVLNRAPVEGRSQGSQEKRFNSNDDRLTPTQMGNLLAKGWTAYAGPQINEDGTKG